MRTMAPGALALLQGPALELALLIDMAYSPPVRVCTARRTLTWAGVDYLGAGQLGAVEPVRDSGTGDLQGLRFSLSGVASSSIAQVLLQPARGRACTLRTAIIDPDTGQVADAPVMGAYLLDQTSIVEQGGQATIGVSAIHLARLFQRPKPLLYTDDDQRRLHPTDVSLQYVVSQASHQDVWPAAAFFRQ